MDLSNLLYHDDGRLHHTDRVSAGYRRSYEVTAVFSELNTDSNRMTQPANLRDRQLALSTTLFFIVKSFRGFMITIYETDSRDVARERCAIPDDALDGRSAGGRGRRRRIGAESARRF